MATEKAGETEVTILFQNERVTVAEMRARPGNRGKMVERPDRVQYAVKGGKIREPFPHGQIVEYELKTGTAKWMDKRLPPWRTSENRKLCL